MKQQDYIHLLSSTTLMKNINKQENIWFQLQPSKMDPTILYDEWRISDIEQQLPVSDDTLFLVVALCLAVIFGLQIYLWLKDSKGNVMNLNDGWDPY